MVKLQQYDIEFRHVKGAHNRLADKISRNPAGLNAAEIRKLTKPNTIMVNAINLSIDKSVCKDLRKLEELQKTDPSIQEIRVRIAQQPNLSDTRYRLVNDTLFYRGARHALEWKPVLQACLEDRLSNAHTKVQAI